MQSISFLLFSRVKYFSKIQVCKDKTFCEERKRKGKKKTKQEFHYFRRYIFNGIYFNDVGKIFYPVEQITRIVR